jgi:cobalamin-dependent methionine synthase I
LNKEGKESFLKQTEVEYGKLRHQFNNKQKYKVLIPYEEAIITKEYFDWKKYVPVKPAVDGVKVFKDFDLGKIARYIDWGPFFIGWEMPGRFPEVLSDPIFGVEATRLYNDAKAMVEKIVSEKWFTASGVIGFWPANSNNRDSIFLQTDKGEVRLESLRQQMKKAIGQPSYSLADFVKPGPQEPIPNPSRREGLLTEPALSLEDPDVIYGYHWADPSYYGLLKKFAETNRKNHTDAELIIWKLGKSKQLSGFKIRRQHIIDKYIADFVCLDKRLIIEIDGLIHQLPENQENDTIRTRTLENLGFKVIRFSNEEVISNPESVAEKIKQELSERESVSSKTPFPSGRAGDGLDYMGAFAVTIHGARKHIDKYIAEHDEYNKILVQILADRFVEAFAECLHQEVRMEHWGYQKNETLTSEQLIREEYKGIRPAPGYPACPDHTEKIKLFDLLNVTENIGIELTESLAMDPPASVCGWYFAHPGSHYFGVGKIGRDQLEDYAKRKGMSMEEAERWLRPVLE